ncbi:hypothetical protein ABE078_18205 [Priestia megaterium]
MTHNRPKPNYVNLIEDMISDLQESMDIVKLAVVKDKEIILETGIGFANTFIMNTQTGSLEVATIAIQLLLKVLSNTVFYLNVANVV